MEWDVSVPERGMRIFDAAHIGVHSYWLPLTLITIAVIWLILPIRKGLFSWSYIVGMGVLNVVIAVQFISYIVAKAAECKCT